MSAKVRLALATTALCALVLLPFAAHWLSPRPPEPAALPREAPGDAVLLIRRHQYDAAYESLRAPSAAPGWDGAPQLRQFRLAVCERALGRHDSAHARLLRLEGQLPPLDAYRRLWIARSLEEGLADSHAAAAGYRDLLAGQVSPVVGDSARWYLASLRERAGDLDGALELYHRQAEASGATPGVLFRIAAVEQRRGHADGARAAWLDLMEQHPAHRLALDAAAHLQPATARQRRARAEVYYRHGDDRRAIDDLRQLLAQYPRDELAPQAACDLGRAYARSGQTGRARRTFERLYEEHRWPPALYRLAGLEVSDGRDLAAVDGYLRFAQAYPDHELADDALWQAAKAAERRDEFARAADLYRRLVALYPASQFAEDADWGIGFSSYCEGRFDAALLAFRQTARRARQPHLVDQSLFWAGKASRQLGQAQEARVLFAEAAQHFPRSYYSTRAVNLGYGEARTPSRAAAAPSAAPTPQDLQRVAGADGVERALLLGQLGLSGVAGRELRLVEGANEGRPDALRLVRDAYDLAGLHDRALALTASLSGGDDGGLDELDRLYPSYYWDEVAQAARDASLDPYLVLSVIRQESYFNADAVSPAGAVGLMQIMPQTGLKLARGLGVHTFDRKLLFDPGMSIQLGSRFLGEQVRAFAASPAQELPYTLGLAAYNAGPGAARQWAQRFPGDDADAFVERIPYRETRLYVKKVLKNYAIYKTLGAGGSDA